jgi:hypothetical protein
MREGLGGIWKRDDGRDMRCEYEGRARRVNIEGCYSTGMKREISGQG